MNDVISFQHMFIRIGTILAMMFAAEVVSATPAVAVVIGEQPPDLERFADDELCGYLSTLFGIEATTATELDECELVFVICSPQTNGLTTRFLGDDGWPQVSEQGLLLKRGRWNETSALIVGGGSPQATLWAVYELVERWSVRYLLQGGRIAGGYPRRRASERGHGPPRARPGHRDGIEFSRSQLAGHQ